MYTICYLKLELIIDLDTDFLKLICFLGTLGAASGWRWSSFEGAFVRASLLPLTTFILQLGIEVVT